MEYKKLILLIGWAPFVYLIYKYISIKRARLRVQKNIFNGDIGIEYFKNVLGESIKPYKPQKNNTKDEDIHRVALNLGLGVYGLGEDARVILNPNSAELVYISALLETYSLATVPFWVRVLYLLSLEYLLGLPGIVLYGIIRLITSERFLTKLVMSKENVSIEEFKEVVKSGQYKGLDYMTRLRYINKINEVKSVDVLGFKIRI